MLDRASITVFSWRGDYEVQRSPTLLFSGVRTLHSADLSVAWVLMLVRIPSIPETTNGRVNVD